MPLHIYQCPAGHVQEVLEGINEDTPRKCTQPGCKKTAVLGCGITAVPIFKRGNGGFYKPSD